MPEEIEELLALFRQWFADAGTAALPGVEPPAVDLHRLVSEFTALRHEVHLQTRAARAQVEQNAQALQALAEAQKSPKDSDSDAVRPLLSALVAAHDALSLAQREVRAARAAAREIAAPEEEPAALATPPAAPPSARPWWRFWARSDAGAQAAWVTLLEQLENQRLACQLAKAELMRCSGIVARLQGAVDALASGYEMSLSRLERALAQQGLQKLDCKGQPFDPETMEAIEVVEEPGRRNTVVIDEVLRGYRWGEKLFRPAQVRVARPERQTGA